MQVKGSAIAGRVNWVRRYHGEAAVTRVLDALRRPVLGATIRQGVAKSEWYPFELFIDLTETIDRVLGKGDGALYAKVAGQSAEDDMKTIYKVFFRLMNPGFIVGKASQLWRQYYSSGEMLVVRDIPGSVALEVRNVETPHAVHCESVRGWTEACVKLTGVRHSRALHSQCRLRGDKTCLFEVLWTVS